jgi:hypothetical protein
VIVGATAAGVAVPVSAIVAVGVCGSLLVMIMLPVSFPAIVGEKEAFNVALAPGRIVLGVDMPETPKGPPLTEINEMTRFAPPVLLTVSEPLVVFPTTVLPKLRLVEFKLICCGATVATPVRAICPEETPSAV